VDPDLAVLDQWRAGDRAAGEALFARHFKDIYRFFEHKVPGEADDLSQRTFLACVAARDAFRRQSSFRTYLFAIARNELFAHLKRVSHVAQVDFEEISIADLVTSPSGRLGRAEEGERLRSALRELPAEQQLLLELHYWHELDAQALAEIFDANPGAIRVRLLRARQALRQRLGELGPGAQADRMTRSLVDGDGPDGAV
jgi:RNA polymerase sigma-70 factor (ECF subfamily)